MVLRIDLTVSTELVPVYGEYSILTLGVHGSFALAI